MIWRRNRAKLRKSGAGLPRLSVCRSGKNIYAQVIDDRAGATLAAASSLDQDIRSAFKKGSNIDAATAVGKLIGERAKKAGVEKVVLDRGGYLFHGRVKALADGARAAGLVF